MPAAFRARYEFSGTDRLIRGTITDLERINPVLVRAHNFLAGQLQKRQADALIRSIDAWGREQRHDWEDSPIHLAIISERNREVTERGFTVGFLADSSRFPDVALYAQGLETGTSAHMGQRLFGFWLTPGGGLVRPEWGAVNAIGFVSNRDAVKSGKALDVRPKGWYIGRRIRGYGFQRSGYEAWKTDGYNNRGAVHAYADFMEAAGLDYAVRLFRPGRNKVTGR